MQKIKRIKLFMACMLFAVVASAAGTPNVVSVSFSEKVDAEVLVSQVVNGKFRKLAEYQVSSIERDFLFLIPGNEAANYRFQVNLLKPDGRHFKKYASADLSLALDPSHSYSLKIVPSKLNVAKKTGWELEQGTIPSFSIIKGTVKNTITGMSLPVLFHTVRNGKPHSTTGYYTDSVGRFEFASKIKDEGIYYLSSLRWRARVYLKPSDRLELDVDNRTGEANVIEGSEENQLLEQWQELIRPITGYGYNLAMFTADTTDLDSYINNYKNLEPGMEEFIQHSTLANKRGLRSIRDAMRIDKDLAPIYLLFQLSSRKVKGFRPTPKDFNEVPQSFQRFIGPGKFESASMLGVGETRQYMNLYAKLSMALVPAEARKGLSRAEKLSLMMQAIPNDTLKCYFFEDLMDEIPVNNLSEFRSTFEPFKKYARPASVREKYLGIYNLFSGDTTYIGKSAYNFSLPDTSGRMVTLEDFKGKVIFIDVWATWCGPCKEQIPFLKEIEEEYRGNKDIVFLGISLDRAQDRKKWINMITKENLPGQQLLDDKGKFFADKYEISAIPRFLLVSKDGKWIEIRCPRPEAKEDLRKYLDDALKQEVITLSTGSHTN